MAGFALAPEAAASPEVVALATDIEAAPDPEIAQTAAWLQASGQPIDTPGMKDMGSDEVEGMENMGGHCPGLDFDSAWTTMVIEHHCRRLADSAIARNLLRDHVVFRWIGQDAAATSHAVTATTKPSTIASAVTVDRTWS